MAKKWKKARAATRSFESHTTSNLYPLAYASTLGMDADKPPITDITTEFELLEISQGHSMKTKGHRRRRAQYIEAEFEKHFGSNTTKLETWQDLCGEVGVKPVPESITKCKKALKHVHINIINLLDHRRSGGLIPLMKFKSGKALREYTMNGHIFPLVYAKADGFIKIFLRQIL